MQGINSLRRTCRKWNSVYNELNGIGHLDQFQHLAMLSEIKAEVGYARVSYRGGGGAMESPPPSHNFSSPEILKLSMVINVLSPVLNNNLRGSKLNFFLREHAPRPPSRHECLCVCDHAFARYCHSVTTMFPPLQLKILYEPLLWILNMASVRRMLCCL